MLTSWKNGNSSEYEECDEMSRKKMRGRRKTHLHFPNNRAISKKDPPIAMIIFQEATKRVKRHLGVVSHEALLG